MGVKFNRRIKLGKNVNINIGKKGLNSVSFKVGKTTINPQRNTFSYNSSIKGLSYQGKLVDTNKSNKSNNINNINSEVIKANDIEYFEDIKKVKGFMQIKENMQKLIPNIEKEFLEIREGKRRVESYIEEINNSNDNELTETEKIILLERFNKQLLQYMELEKENIEQLNQANETKEKAEKEISFLENKYNMNRYDIINIYNNKYAINTNTNNKGLSNDTEGIIFAIILFGIIFFFIAIICG